MIADQVSAPATTPRMAASKMAACSTSVLENAVPAAKLRCENILSSITVNSTCMRLAAPTQNQNAPLKEGGPSPAWDW